MVAELKVRNRRSKLQDQGPSRNLSISTVPDKIAKRGQCHQASSCRRCESDPQSHKETMSMLTKKLSEKLTAEEMDEMIQKQTLTDISVKQQTVEEIVEVAHSVPRIRGNESQSRSRTCPCRKEQTVEATKGIPYQRVSRRIVKQIVDQCHKWQEQNIKDSRNRATSCEHEDTIFSVSGQDPTANF